MSKRSKEKKLKKERKDQVSAEASPPQLEGVTLHAAAGAGKLHVMTGLLDAGAEVDLLDQYGQTPLMVAIGMSQRQAVGALLSAGARLDSTDDDGRDIVMSATRQPDIKILEMVLAAGADPTGLTPHGETALGFALSASNLETISLLRQAGAREPIGNSAFEEVARVRSEALEADLGGGGVRMARLTDRAAEIPAGAALLNAFSQHIGFSSIANRWRKSNRAGLSYMLNLDLIRAAPIRTDEAAADLAARFLELFDRDDVALYTTLKKFDDGCHSYTPVTHATFNVVTVGVTDQRMGIIWVDQEDD